MNKPKFDKPALSADRLAELFLYRGLTGISSEELAHKLKFLNYYRLRGYTYPYQNNGCEDAPFITGTCWDDIWSDYCFDQNLRMVIFDAISRFEIAFRSILVLYMSERYGSQWYEDRELYETEKLAKECEQNIKPHVLQDKTHQQNHSRFDTNFRELLNLWERSHEDFKYHYTQKYNTDLNPPAWMLFEITTMGIVSKIFANIKNGLPEKIKILNTFGFNRSQVHVFVSWNHHLNFIRNICAHHGRLFSRNFSIKPKFCKTTQFNWVNTQPENTRIYATFCILSHLLSVCAPEYPFNLKLRDVLSNANLRQHQWMGVPNDWTEQPLFKETSL